MSTTAQSLALRVVDAATDPLVVIAVSLVVLAVFSGLVGRLVLLVETRLSVVGSVPRSARRRGVGIR